MNEFDGDPSPKMTRVALKPASFEDVDQFAEWEKGLGWDADFLQLSAGRDEIGFDHFDMPGLVVAHFTRKQASKDFFALPAGKVICVIARAKQPLVWCGKELPPTLIAIVRSGREQWVVMPAGFDCYEFMIDEELIRRTEMVDPAFFENTTQIERALLPAVEPVTGEFLHHLDWFFQAARGANGDPGTHVPRNLLFDFVLDGLQQVFEAGVQLRGTPRPRTVRRPDLVANARDFALAHLKEDVSAEEMADALGVSYRVLNYAFKDALGMSPYRYLLTLRLRAVRRQLLATGGTVTDASFGHGFYTPSRFIRRYSQFFGERPSETKNRARRRA